MLKKIMLLGASIAAFVAIAAPASQAIELYEEPSTPLVPGAQITATSTNLEFVFTGLGALKCSLVTVHGEVTKNGPEVNVVGLGELTTTGCSVPTTDGTLATILLNNGDKGTATGFKLTLDGLNCTLSGGLEAEATTGTDLLHVSGTVGGTAPFCNTGVHVKGTFTLETSNSTPLEWQ